MKLIINISKEAYNGIKIGMRNRDDMREVGEAIENGIPFDKIRTEITEEIEAYRMSDWEANDLLADGLQLALNIIDGAIEEGDES